MLEKPKMLRLCVLHQKTERPTASAADRSSFAVRIETYR